MSLKMTKKMKMEKEINKEIDELMPKIQEMVSGNKFKFDVIKNKDNSISIIDTDKNIQDLSDEVILNIKLMINTLHIFDEQIKDKFPEE